MGDVWFQVLTRSARDLAELTAQFRPKVLAEDIVGYEREISRDPSNASLRNSAAMLCLELGNAARALEHFSVSARLDPDNPAAHFNVGTALSLNNRLDDAAREFERALALRPDYAPARNNLGIILLQRGDVAAARTQFREALRVDPSNAEAHRNLANANRQSGDVPAAIAEYREALKVRADWPAAMADLAWVLATARNESLRDPGQAIRLAERTASLTGRRDPAVLDVLAAAYASAGDFDLAVSTAQAALELAPKGPGADAIRVRLDLYRRGTPFFAR
jgi:tetratricopeptide (TPR) repeat protein